MNAAAAAGAPGEARLDDARANASGPLAPSLSADTITATNVVVGTQIVQIRPDAGARLPFDLPPPDGPLVGRDVQPADAGAQVKSGARTLMVTGLAGVGKRSFAVALARLLAADFPDGQIVADLCGFSTSHPPRSAVDVLREFYARMHPYGGAARLTDESVRGEYLSALQGARAIVVLTNARDAAQFAQLLPPATCLTIITSQSELRTGTPVALKPLAARDAVALLRNGLEDQLDARQAGRLAALCGQLPAALVFARGYLLDHDLTPAESYLDQLQARSLADALSVSGLLQVSVEDLSEAARAALLRLSIMPAPFDLAAACAVIGCDAAAGTDALQALKRLNLVDYERASGRFSMHVLVRDFARVRLTAQDAAHAEERHVGHFRAVAAEADAGYLAGGERMLWGLAAFDRERAHIARALDLAMQRWSAMRDAGAARCLIGMSDAVTYIGELRLAPADRERWLTAALDALRSGGASGNEAMTCTRLGNTFLERGDSVRAAPQYDQAARLAQRAGDGQTESLARLCQSAIEQLANRGTEADALVSRAIDLARSAGSKRAEGWAVCQLAAYAEARGQSEVARNLLVEALDLARSTGDLFLETMVGGRLLGLGSSELVPNVYELATQLGDPRLKLLVMGNLTHIVSDPRAAKVEFGNLLQAAREAANRRDEATSLAGLCCAALLLHERVEAVTYGSEAVAIVKALGDQPLEMAFSQLLGTAYAEIEDWGKSIDYFSVALALCTDGARAQRARAHAGLANAYAQRHENEAAKRHYARALTDARASGDAAAQLDVLVAYPAWLLDQGDADAALELYGQATEVAHGAARSDREGFFLNRIGLIQQQRKDYGAAAASYVRAAQVLQQTTDAFQRRLALLGATLAYRAAQDYPNAIRYGEQALALAHDEPAMALGLHTGLGLAYMATRDPGSAASHFEAAAALAAAQDQPAVRAQALINLAFALGVRGQRAAALERYQQASRIAAELHDEGLEAQVRQGIGMVAAEPQPAAPA